MRRVFLIVLDSFGVGAAPDACLYGDAGKCTVRSVAESGHLDVPLLRSLGLFNIDGVSNFLHCVGTVCPLASFARLVECSKGKDTTTGHWELMGIISKSAFPIYPKGFPDGIIRKFIELTGRGVLCNRPYSGTEVIRDYGLEHIKTGKLIVYTSADSVFQIAAHEGVVPVDELYVYCQRAREILVGGDSVSRVIARPFVGSYPGFVRTSNRKDFSVFPPGNTVLDLLQSGGCDVIGVGKIFDIFAGKGISRSVHVRNNSEGLDFLSAFIDQNFEGLCFANLVDFDTLYGHRNDAKGYALALNAFDKKLVSILEKLRSDDILIVTADHGCDPGDISTDHTREFVPMLIYGKKIIGGINLGTLGTFSDVGATILDYFGIENELCGTSFLSEVLAC